MLHAIAHALAWLWGGDGQGGAEGDGYLITSGPLAASAVFGAMVGLYWKNRCDEPRCWWIGRYREPDGREVCARHRAKPPVELMDSIAEVRRLAEEHDKGGDGGHTA